MEIKYDTYGEPIYDTLYFETNTIKNLCVGEIIIYKNNPCKITKISRSGKGCLRWIYVKNIFTDDIGDSVYFETQDVLIPKIITSTYEFVNMTNTTIELFNENTNDILEIIVDLKIDKNIVEKINDKIKTKTEFKVNTIEFKNLIRIISIY
jgi:translation elongation factor P/translation initiation factor 5A